MIEYTLPVNKANLFVWGFKDSVRSISTTAHAWLITDLEMTATDESDLHVGDVQDQVESAGTRGLVVTDAFFRMLTDASDQVNDGEFIGSEADASAVRDPLVRIDAFDSSEWTVLLDPARVQVDATFRKWFAAGTDGAPFTRRGSESWS